MGFRHDLIDAAVSLRSGLSELYVTTQGGGPHHLLRTRTACGPCKVAQESPTQCHWLGLAHPGAAQDECGL